LESGGLASCLWALIVGRLELRHSAAWAELVGRKVGGSSGLGPPVPTPRIVLPEWIASALRGVA